MRSTARFALKIVGIGKTTELRRYAGQLNQSKRFYVVEVDVLVKLDRNNLSWWI